MFNARDLLNACQGKVQYATRAEARRNVKAIQRHKAGSHSLRAYACASGNHWHLTSMDPKQFRALRHEMNAYLDGTVASRFADASPIVAARSEYDH